MEFCEYLLEWTEEPEPENFNHAGPNAEPDAGAGCTE